jgi:isopentenyl-diphosphate delta-isomerase
MPGREDLAVELVDEAGAAIGSCSVAEAHTAPGRTHRAFSVLLRDESGRVLLQRRAAVKTRFARRWSNTCCGHPGPGEDVAAAAARRLTAEMGLTPEHITPLTEVGVLAYQASDPASGRVEREWDHVLVATLTGGTPAPDPAEVSECAWVSPAAVLAGIATNPGNYTPWLPGVLDTAGNATAAAPPPQPGS